MRYPLSSRLVCLLVVLLPAAACPSPLLINTLEALRDQDTAVVQGAPLLSGRLLADFYAQRGQGLLWTDPKDASGLLRRIEASPDEGLSPTDFHAAIVRRLAAVDGLAGLTESERLAADILLSDALLRYVHHTRYGKLDPISVNPKWNDRPPIPAGALISDMGGALDAPDLADYLATRLRTPFWYDQLRAALRSQSKMGHLRGLAPLPDGPVLSLGSRSARVAMARERLQLMGHASGPLPQDLELFDDGLREAVRHFQGLAGLSQDGVVGPRTLAAINAPVDGKSVERIRINLERMRWLFNDLPQDYVFVDVADYMAYLVRDGKVSWSTRVIVGSQEDQTPMFRDSMDHLVFNPTWNVPVSIQKEMGGLSSKYTLVDRRTGRQVSGGDARDYKRYRVVQKPGPGNALGRVKFMFPNRHAVYLHDTPSRGLFGRSSRALSHGCVRVQDPLKLAELILGELGWDPSQIERTLSRSKTRYVNLKDELPVLLYYLTARAGEGGAVSIRRDIYGRDPALMEAFAGPVLGARIAFPEPAQLPAQDIDSEGPGGPAGDQRGPAPASEDAPSGEPPSQEGVRLTQADPEGLPPSTRADGPSAPSAH